MKINENFKIPRKIQTSLCLKLFTHYNGNRQIISCLFSTYKFQAASIYYFESSLTTFQNLSLTLCQSQSINSIFFIRWIIENNFSPKLDGNATTTASNAMKLKEDYLNNQSPTGEQDVVFVFLQRQNIFFLFFTLCLPSCEDGRLNCQKLKQKCFPE